MSSSLFPLLPEHEELLGPVDAVAGVLDRPRDAVEEGSTSGVSTINSTKSAKLLHDLHHSKHCHLLQDNLQATRVENLRSASNVLFYCQHRCSTALIGWSAKNKERLVKVTFVSLILTVKPICQSNLFYSTKERTKEAAPLFQLAIFRPS